MFDTHCHLNFKAFDGEIEDVIKSAREVGVNDIVVPGTDVETSKKAVEIAEKFSNIYAAVGIHPHHIFQHVIASEAKQSQKEIATATSSPRDDINQIEQLLTHPKVVAVGEIGIDRHEYKKTVYQVYQIHQEFIDLQKEFFIEQIKLAHKYKKTLIIHNREAKKDVLDILTSHYSLIPSHSCVFHCCEPDEELLKFAKKHKMFIGVDGDVVYWKEKLFGYAQSKQEFIKKVPLEMLVLETDSPFLSPFRKFPNEPKNISFIAEFIAELKNTSIKRLIEVTTENAKKLFKI